MATLESAPRTRTLGDRWWVWVVRGLAAMAFGIITLVWPQIGLAALVGVFAGFAVVEGVFTLYLAIRRAQAGATWGWLVFGGIIDILAGVAALVWPGLTAIGLLAVVAAWAVVRGIAEIVAAIELRRYIQGEWMLVLAGLLSIAFGVVAVIKPGAGALAILWLIAAYAVAYGLVLIGLGVEIRRWFHPPAAMKPTHA